MHRKDACPDCGEPKDARYQLCRSCRQEAKNNTPPRICVIEGCDKLAGSYATGWCPMHYQRWKSHGDVMWEPHPKTPEERFWEKVNKNGPLPEGQPELGECWVWTASKHGSGHGEFFISKERGKISAHGFSLEIAIGPCPEGMEGCHHCDNPPCVRPDHVYWGTRQDNVNDSIRRDRHARGERNGHAIATEAEVLAIREG